MLYNVNDPDSPFWSFLATGRRGRFLTAKQEALLMSRKGAPRDGFNDFI
jgi:hypothetical protein